MTTLTVPRVLEKYITLICLTTITFITITSLFHFLSLLLLLISSMSLFMTLYPGLPFVMKPTARLPTPVEAGLGVLEAAGDPPVEDVKALEDLEDEDGGPAEDEDDHEHGEHRNYLEK